ncbi:hypothetical protein [Sphingobacterium faecium]|uniref:hypothetical protein n=1 Tax=Sphingobacterium faecium TaxID=34087 RepID=UPI00320B278B
MKTHSQSELAVLVLKTVGDSLAEYAPLLDMVFRDYPDLATGLFGSLRGDTVSICLETNP